MKVKTQNSLRLLSLLLALLMLCSLLNRNLYPIS